jgi:two-component system, response regulator
MRPRLYISTIVVAEDDEDDRLLLKEAFEELQVLDTIHFVKDGDELLDCLSSRNQYEQSNLIPAPELVILDWNMPRKDGQEVLKVVKSNPLTRHIPIVILTTSSYAEDVSLAYELGANSFIVKPLRFDALVKVIRIILAYWLQVVALPGKQLD